MSTTFRAGCLTAAALLSASVAAAEAKTPVMQSPYAKARKISHANTDRKLSVLYDQTSNDSGTAFVSQNFESTYSNYDVAAADDFVVPKGQTWAIKEVDVVGKYFNGYGPAASEDLVLYKDSNDQPGKPVKKGVFTGLSGVDDDGSFTITLPKKVKLGEGRYWVSVVANCSFTGGCGEWGWELQTTHEGDDAMSKSGNSGWTDIGSGDLMFALKGKAK